MFKVNVAGKFVLMCETRAEARHWARFYAAGYGLSSVTVVV